MLANPSCDSHQASLSRFCFDSVHSHKTFLFSLILCWIPLLLCNMLQQCRFERLVSNRASGRAMSAKASARQMMRQTMVRKPKETIPVTCNRCGQHLPADTFPRCTPCIYSQLFSGMWWLTLALIPLIFFVWAVSCLSFFSPLDRFRYLLVSLDHFLPLISTELGSTS